MPRRRNMDPAPIMVTGSTDASGVATLVVPLDQFLRYDGCVGMVVDGSAPCTVQILSEPSIGADLRTAAASARTIRAQVYRSNTITSLLVTLGVQALVPAGAGIVVRGLAWGI